MTLLSKNARVAGLLYILSSVVGAVRLVYIPSALLASDDAATRAGKILAHESLFRIGIASQLLAAALWLFVPLALYRLFRGVDRGLAILMVILGSLMQVPLFFMNSLNDVAALLLVRGGDFLSGFDQAQRDGLAMVFLRLHHQGDIANEIFWGLWLIPFGLLVYRSRFLPRLLGVWLIVSCFGWLTLSFTAMLLPALEGTVFKITQPIALVELVTMLWLAIVGAKEKSPATAF